MDQGPREIENIYNINDWYIVSRIFYLFISENKGSMMIIKKVPPVKIISQNYFLRPTLYSKTMGKMNFCSFPSNKVTAFHSFTTGNGTVCFMHANTRIAWLM